MSKGANQSNPVAAIGYALTLVIIGFSTRYCMKKYGGRKKRFFR